MPVAALFCEDELLLRQRDEAEIVVPVSHPHEGLSKLIVIGFQLTREKPEFNREQRRRIPASRP